MRYVVRTEKLNGKGPLKGGGAMQKKVPIVVAVVVLLVVGIAIASMAVRRTRSGTTASGARSGKGVAASAYSATVRPTTAKEQTKYQQTLQSALAEAQKLYDAKDYAGAFDKADGVLKTIDSSSQAAKNLRQMAQLRLIEQRRAGK